MSSAVGARIEAPREVGCKEGVFPSRPVEGAVSPPQNFFSSIFELKKEFWCVLGLTKPTFDRPGVSIFWPAAVLGREGEAIAPVDPPLY